MNKIPAKILVVQTAFLGDVIMSTTIFKGLKKIWPDATIDVVAIPETAAVLKNNPHLNQVYKFDKRKKLKKYFNLISLVFRIKRNSYDAAFSVQSSLTSSLIIYLARIKMRVGYHHQKLTTHKIQSDKSLHIRKRVLLLLQNFTPKKLNTETEVFISASDKQKANDFIKAVTKSKMIAIAPGSVWATKKWPKEHFTELIKKCKDYSIFLIGGSGDFKLNESIIKNCNHPKIVNLAGKLSILESCALIKEMDLVICNDSAPLHMANAVNTPVFAIFGPTVKKFGCYPYRENDKILEIDLDCRPCAKHGSNKCPINHHNCMIQLQPESVFKEIKTFFEKKQLN